jgi:hypothetical protein
LIRGLPAGKNVSELSPEAKDVLDNLGPIENLGLKDLNSFWISLRGWVGAQELKAPADEAILRDEKTDRVYMESLSALFDKVRSFAAREMPARETTVEERLQRLASAGLAPGVYTIPVLDAGDMGEKARQALFDAAAAMPDSLFIVDLKDDNERPDALNEVRAGLESLGMPGNVRVVTAHAEFPEEFQGKTRFVLSQIQENPQLKQQGVEIQDGTEVYVIADLAKLIIDKAGCRFNVSIIPLGPMGDIIIASTQFEHLFKAALYYAQQA